jgi:chromosomal replication initiation ATPase DnaA
MSTHEQRTGSRRTDDERRAAERRASREQYAFIKSIPELYADLLARRRQWWADLKTNDPARYEATLIRQREWRRRNAELKRQRREAKQAKLRALGRIEVAAKIQAIPRESVSKAFEAMDAAKAVQARLLKVYGLTIDELKDTGCRPSNVVACRRHILEEVKRVNPHWPLSKLRDIAGFRDHTSVIYALRNLDHPRYLRARRTLAP